MTDWPTGAPWTDALGGRAAMPWRVRLNVMLGGTVNRVLPGSPKAHGAADCLPTMPKAMCDLADELNAGRADCAWLDGCEPGCRAAQAQVPREMRTCAAGRHGAPADKEDSLRGVAGAAQGAARGAKLVAEALGAAA